MPMRPGVLPEDNITGIYLIQNLMNCLMPRPGEIEKRLQDIYNRESPEAATDYYYKRGQVRRLHQTYRIKKDMRWVTAESMAILALPSTYPSLRRIRKPIAAASWRNRAVIPSVSSVWRTRGYAGRRIIRPEQPGSFV